MQGTVHAKLTISVYSEVVKVWFHCAAISF